MKLKKTGYCFNIFAGKSKWRRKVEEDMGEGSGLRGGRAESLVLVTSPGLFFSYHWLYSPFIYVSHNLTNPHCVWLAAHVGANTKRHWHSFCAGISISWSIPMARHTNLCFGAVVKSDVGGGWGLHSCAELLHSKDLFVWDFPLHDSDLTHICGPLWRSLCKGLG